MMYVSRTNHVAQSDATATTEASTTTAASTTPPNAGVSAASVLPDPTLEMCNSSGDLLAELVTLLTLASRSDRDAARTMERLEDITRTQEEQKKVEAMHAQADDIRAAAWASGIADIGQGICQVGGSLSTQVDCKFDWNDAFKSSSLGFKAGGEIFEGFYKAQEKLDAADAEVAGANADRAGRGSKEANEDVAAAREMLKKVVSFYEQMLQAQSAALNAAANWRA